MNQKTHIFKVTFFTKITVSKSHISQKVTFQKPIFHKNRTFQNRIFFYKNHIFKIAFFTKIALLQLTNSSEFTDKNCDFAPVSNNFRHFFNFLKCNLSFFSHSIPQKMLLRDAENLKIPNQSVLHPPNFGPKWTIPLKNQKKLLKNSKRTVQSSI